MCTPWYIKPSCSLQLKNVFHQVEEKIHLHHMIMFFMQLNTPTDPPCLAE